MGEFRGRLLLTSLIVLLAAVSATSGTARAQRNIGVQPRAGTDARGYYADSWAVLIGIDEYQHQRVPKLRYAVNDARAVERALLGQGFTRDRVITLLDRQATKAAIERVLGDQLRTKMGPEDRLLVFFAGHGKTDRLRSGDQEGYLIPVDGDPGSLFSTAISMDSLRKISDRLPAKHVLYVMDACYSGYAIYNRSISDDLLEEMVKKPAIQILTAGRQGDEAQERGGHGIFTEVFLRGIQGEAFGGKGWLSLEELGTWVKQRVYAESGKRQLPQSGTMHGEGQFVFLKPGAVVAAVTPVVPPRPAEPTITKEIVREYGSLAIRGRLPGIEVWLDERKLGTTETGSALVLNNLAAGTYTIKAKKPGHKDWGRTVEVGANQRAEMLIDIEALGPAKVIKGDDGAEMVLVPAGEFLMGSDQAEVDRFVEGCKKAGVAEQTCKGRGQRETPRHRVHLDAYYVDRYEVTNALFERFVRATGHQTSAERGGDGWVWQQKDGKWQWVKVSGASWRAPGGPGTATSSDHPVVQVSWLDADAYCRWAGKRLPTEAEWEKAARGTDGRRYPWGEEWDASRANGAMSVKSTRPAGSYPSGVSPYGAHDMAGNVAEWVADWLDEGYYQRSTERNPRGPDSGQYRVLRGGSWNYLPILLRTAGRLFSSPDFRNYNVGFRCARAGS